MAYPPPQPARLPAPPRPRARLRQGRPPRPAHGRRDDPGDGPRSRRWRDRRHPRRELLPADREQAGAPAAEGRRAATRHDVRDEARGDLHRVWETERPFELHLDGVTISGRADVILDHEDGVPTALAHRRLQDLGRVATAPTTPCSCRSTPTPAARRPRRSRRLRPRPQGGRARPDRRDRGRHRRAPSRRSPRPPSGFARATTRRTPEPGAARCEVRTVCKHAQR